MSKEVKINYNNTFATQHSRDYYRGASFHWSGEWMVGAHYLSDDYTIDYVVHGQVLLACAKSHLSTLDNEPKDFITDESGTVIGVVSTYWDFVLSGIVGKSPGIKIQDNYWYICKDTGVPEEQQVWENTGVKAKMELSDLTPEEIEILQRPGKEVVTEFINNTITQETGQDSEKIMSQKAVTTELDKKATKSELSAAVENEVLRANGAYQPKGDYATNQKVDNLQEEFNDFKKDTDDNFELVGSTLETLQDNIDVVADNIPTKVSELENDSNYQTRSNVDTLLQPIKDVIPLTATAINQLADKNFVNSSIATSTATFQGTSAAGLTQAQFEAWLETLTTADDNDYVFWNTVDSAGNVVFKRYKYNGTAWVYEYDLNNSSFTSTEWAAIQSGVTAELVTKLVALPTNADLTAALNNKVDKVTGKRLSTEDYTTEEKNKLAGIANGAEVNVQSDWNVTDTNSDAFIKNKPQNLVQDADYVHTDNNYTTEEKTKLSGIAEGAQVNVLEGVKVDGTELPITDKKVNIDLSGKVDIADSETNSDEFVYRQTGGGLDIEVKNARISSIKGKTLVWNQQLKNGDFSNGITYWGSRNAQSVLSASNGVLTVSVPVDTGPRYGGFGQSYTFIVGHKYFFSGTINSNDVNNFSLVSGTSTGYSINVTLPVGKVSTIIQCSQYSIDNGLNIYRTTADYAIQTTFTAKNIILIDLTQLFGSGNEPSTAAEFESWLASNLGYRDYYAYNAGEIISNNTEALEITGLNQWDEEWEEGNIFSEYGKNNDDGSTRIRSKNYIPIVGGQRYFIKCPTLVAACVYDANKTIIGWMGNNEETAISDVQSFMSNHVMKVPQNASYMRFVTASQYGNVYNHDICINISDTSKNGTYEPYRKSTIQLNLSSFQVLDSQGNVTTIEGGLKSAGSVYDEIVGNKYIKRVGSVDLGDLTWAATSSSGGTDGYSAHVPTMKVYTKQNLICSKFVTKFANSKGSIYAVSTLVVVPKVNDTYTNSATFKTAMNGVMLYYELATPIEYELAESIRTDYLVDKLGTERVISDTVPTPPFRADIEYHEANIKDIEIEGITEYLKREELTDELDKLDSIEEGAQENKIEHIQINGTEQAITNKTVNLPAYPTTLPASDVSSWAKASTKPSYNLSEIGNADDVKAIENLTGTSGYLKKTGSNTWTLNTTVVTVRELGTVDNELNNLAYGIQWTKNASTCTRVGNPLLHRTLPIQSQMKGCVEKNGEVVYWLNSSDWAYKENGDASALDGTDGYVRVYVPKFYGKSWDTTESGKVMISPVKIDDTWVEIPEHFEDAYESALDRTNLKLCSVMNTTTQYRGGTNSTAYDSSEAMKSLLGKPVTNISRATARTYASNAGSELLNYNIYKWIFLWLPVIEYCNFDLQTAINANLTADGYHQGGLGSGATTFSPWGNYNDYNPIIPCGLTNSLGNGSGQVGINYAAFDSYAAGTVYANRYRGLECPFGNVWTNLDGVIVDSNHSDYDLVYTCDDASKYGDSITSYYTNTSKSIHTEGYVKEFDLGSTGEITAISVGGGKADCHFTGSVSSTLRTLLAGGRANYGDKGGPGCLSSHIGVSDSGANFGFRSIKRIY